MTMPTLVVRVAALAYFLSVACLLLMTYCVHISCVVLAIYEIVMIHNSERQTGSVELPNAFAKAAKFLLLACMSLVTYSSVLNYIWENRAGSSRRPAVAAAYMYAPVLSVPLLVFEYLQNNMEATCEIPLEAHRRARRGGRPVWSAGRGPVPAE